LVIWYLSTTFCTEGWDEEANTQDGITQFDFIPFVQITFWKCILDNSVLRSLPNSSLPNLGAVDIGPVKTAKVPYTNIGGIDVKETVMA
jgi:hypothetical protein